MVDAALHHLPVTHLSAFQRVSLVGPNGGTRVDTEHYQRQVRGRGAGRKVKDLILQFPIGAARIQPDWGQRTRIDRHGLWVKPGRVLGATARTLREELERCDSVHLCRESDCSQPGAVHCKAYSAVDSEAVVGLGAYGRFSGWRCLVLLWRGLVKTKRWIASWCTCCSTRPTTSRRISEQGVLRALDPDSESEAEVTSDPCEGVLVGLDLQGKPRALAPDGCEDRAASEPTRLMEGDVHLSDLGGRVTARLFNHHSQLYLLSCQGRKCSVVSCLDKVHGAHKGTPLCMKHLSESGRSLSPAPKARANPGSKPEEPILSSIRRAQSVG